MQPTDKNKKAPAGEQGAILRDHFYKSKSIKKRTGNQDYLLSQALELAENGIPNFPCRKNKAPAICGWNERYSTDPRELKLNYTFYSSPKLIGVPTGAVSGFDVLDIDPRNDGNKWLYEKIDYLPYTRIHHTPSYGLHFFFRHHEGLRNSASKIAAGVDVRADGGYVIWWPSADLIVENETELADWPEWLLEILKPKPVQRIDFAAPHNLEISDKYARAALRHAAESVASAPEGTRNDTLNREVWSLMRFVEHGLISVRDVANTLAAAGLAAGLAHTEVQKTLTSAIRARGIA